MTNGLGGGMVVVVVTGVGVTGLSEALVETEKMICYGIHTQYDACAYLLHQWFGLGQELPKW